jgi:hypothetical protein
MFHSSNIFEAHLMIRSEVSKFVLNCQFRASLINKIKFTLATFVVIICTQFLMLPSKSYDKQLAFSMFAGKN